MKSRLLAYGFVILGLIIIIGGMAYRLSIAPLWAVPPQGEVDRQRFAMAANIVLLGGGVAIAGACVAFFWSLRMKEKQ